MDLNDFGRIVQTTWRAIPEHFCGVVLDTAVVMPNHLHGILVLTGRRPAVPELAVVAWRTRHPGSPQPAQHGSAPSGSAPQSIGAIVGAFKSSAAKGINALRGGRGAGVWQRGYYERIITDAAGLVHIRNYIASNPARWNPRSR